jgi:CspA family cold shock protein
MAFGLFNASNQHNYNERKLAVYEETNRRRMMPEGTVKWFSTEKGYGFIEQESGSDLFVHQNDVASAIREGDRVEFEVGEGQKGPCAKDVRAI